MFRFIASLAAFVAWATSASAQDINNIETQFWELAASSGSVESLRTFVETFPESPHVPEAEDLISGLEDDDRRRDFEQMIFERIGDVRYDVPMSFGNEGTIGQSISSIVGTSPMYPPIEGLREELWKEQTCGSCHQWTRADLCTQSETYIAKKPVKYQEKQHPFGGMLKINLRNWAQGGCQ